jgi:hypothetical protein
MASVMSSTKELSGICHNIGAHAVSGLCYFLDHFLPDCQKVGLRYGIVNLVGEPFLPENIDFSGKTLLAAEALKEKFQEIVLKTGHSLELITQATLIFEVNSTMMKTRIYRCKSKIKTVIGKSFEHDVSSID